MSNLYRIAKVAVSAAVFSFDKPFDYIVPSEYNDISVGQRVLVPFGRGNGLVKGFVLALAESSEITAGMKTISFLYRDDVVLTRDDIALALWMRNKFFCTFFECANAMIPPAVWQKPTEKYRIGLSEAEVKGETENMLIDLLRSEGCPMTLTEIKKALDKPDKIEQIIKKLVKSEHILMERSFANISGRNVVRMVSAAVKPPYDEKKLGRGKLREKREAVLNYLCECKETAEKELCYQTGADTAIIRDLNRKGLVDLRDVPFYMAETLHEPPYSEAFTLSVKQKEIYSSISEMIDSGEAGCALLHGVTGSGKTAIYVELIRKVISQGKTAIMLVPEIALTPQMVRGFRRHFGSRVAVMHSTLTDQERYKEYIRVKMGRADIVIGTRSAVFAPLDNLGIIIIDEEHETTYKSESAPRYHAIDVAKYRCVKAGCPLLLGSATPSVESYYNAMEGKYSLYTLEERYNEAALPRTIIADMKESLKSGDDLSIGKILRDELTMNLALGEQSILFINRRGNSKMAMCVDCGYVPECENCSVSLTYHSANGRLMCHHCGYSIPLIDKCPECGGGHIKLVGLGTQKIENEIAELYPQARVMRMDADTTEGRRSHEEILDAFGNGEADILLGTQMVAKGLDFPDVTLVGVIDADQALQSGSYLAGERSFSLISQVVGRAGRREKLGRAVIQSFAPSNPVIRAAAAQDYKAFYDYEIDVRQLVKAPPFYDIFTFFLSGEDDEHVKNAADSIAKGLKSAFNGKYNEIASPVLGPAPAAIAKVNNKYRYTVVFKGKENKISRTLVSDILAWFASLPVSKGISIAADINTFSF